MADLLGAVNAAPLALSFGPWLSAGAIILSACIGGVIALFSINEQRKIARRRATLDMLVKKEWDREYAQARAKFIKLRNSELGLGMWATKDHHGSEQYLLINSVLNDYEIIALGIRKQILDEEFYKLWFRTSFLKDYNAARPFIEELRTNISRTNVIFKELEALAVRWEKEPNKP